jgi:hypothetical protein
MPVGTEPAGVRIGSIEVSASISTFSDKWAYFNSTLDAGTSYTLVVALVQGAAFANSNIFWDGEKLTFDILDLGHQYYQGVVFKFGSLVGMSPVSGTFSTSRIIYTPTEIITGAYSSWGEIPYWDDNSDVGDPDIDALKGDICKYINPGFRLPKFGEFSITGWSKFINNNQQPSNDEGTAHAWSYYGFLWATGHVWNNGDFQVLNASGRYLYGSAYDATSAYVLGFTRDEINLSNIWSPRDFGAAAVRCIRN